MQCQRDEIDVLLLEIQQHIDRQRSLRAARLACMAILVYYTLVIYVLAVMCASRARTIGSHDCVACDVTLMLYVSGILNCTIAA
jgi:hypothetical protein